MQTQIYGYTIIPLMSTDDIEAAYILDNGKRKIALHRNVPNPEMLFAVNYDNFMKSGKIKGHTWFTDATGELEPVK